MRDLRDPAAVGHALLGRQVGRSVLEVADELRAVEIALYDDEAADRRRVVVQTYAQATATSADTLGR